MKGNALGRRKQADVLIIPCFQGNKAEIASKEKITPIEALSTKDFTGKLGSSLLIYPEKAKEKRYLFIGLGERKKASSTGVRIAYANAVKTLHQKHDVKEVNVLMPRLKLSDEESYKAVMEGLYLANYHYSDLFGVKKAKEKRPLIESFSILGIDKKGLQIAEETQALMSSVYLSRNLVNGNADDITPSFLAKTAEEIVKGSSKASVNILNKKELEKEGLGLLLAVARASREEPKLIIINYKGDPSSKESVALIGKGITYDTGGLSLKPTSGMLDMKCDMGGSAAVLGTLDAAIKLKLKRNILGVVPATENSIDSDSYKVGDVYRAYNGKMVEITNTDAEGRLALADAMSYVAKNYQPSCMIDLATLTGACMIALGDQISGLFTNSDKLFKDLERASKKTGEPLWRMPLHRDYFSMMKSDFGDFKNSGDRFGSLITSALFLEEFTEDIPWAHFDIAGPAFLAKPFSYYPKHGTGYGVRLLIEWLLSSSLRGIKKDA